MRTTESIKCIAAPILDNHKVARYAVSIAGPANRMTDEAIERYKEPFLKTIGKLNKLFIDFAT